MTADAGQSMGAQPGRFGREDTAAPTGAG